MASSREKKVSPRLIAGFRDLSPREMILKRRILEIVIEQFELFGFDPFDSASIQLQSVLFGADEWTDMQCYDVWNGNSKRTAASEKMALRFDLTVALGRYIAENIKTIPRPFSRWQIGQAFRGEKPSVGRYREFSQVDADIAFAPNLVSDAQIISLINSVMLALGVSFKIKLNNRKILDGLPVAYSFDPDLLVPILTILDKRDKIGRAGLMFELHGSPDDEGNLKTRDTGLSNEQIDQLCDFVYISGNTEDRLRRVEMIMRGSPKALEGVAETRTLLGFIDATGVNPDFVEVDPGLARGLDYYTGPIFETFLTDRPELGAVFSGGRYDNLVERFIPAKVPAVGASFGIDRFMAYALEVDLFNMPLSLNEVLVAYQPSTVKEATLTASVLRKAGLRVKLYDGPEITFREQIGHAKMLKTPWVVIVGGDEVANGQVSLKNIIAFKQQTMPLADAIRIIQGS